jgi:putative DNA primase/helicase
MSEKIQDRARGRWRDILVGLGVPTSALTGKHGPCPLCGGKDRFRWDDKGGSGSFICSHCGSGNGVDFAMKWLKCDFIAAKREIEKHLPSASVHVRKAGGSVDKIRDWMASIWSRAIRLDGSDAASKFLAARGLALGGDYPSQLRFAAEHPYWNDDKTKSYHPAMIAKFVSPDAKDFTLHFTYLTADGRKAAVPRVRKIAPGPLPRGGAVRLAPSAEIMGIAEGIETALAAMQMFEIPVWAALSAPSMMNWKPPPTARTILVCADHDLSFAGQSAAFGLAYRLRTEGLGVEVKLPDKAGNDWNDILLQRQA